MNESNPSPTVAASPEVAPSAPLDPVVATPPAPPPALVVEGDRLGTPPGAAPTIQEPNRPRPTYGFLVFLSAFTLVADLGTKFWAEKHLDGYPGTVEIWKNHMTLILAQNRGGAWGLLQGTSENVRRPFFLLVSVAAIAFIVTLYRRLQPRQRALRWGLPLVLGGALGNVFDRIRYGHVIDFIDVHMPWRGIDHHWPTFNVADIAICVGVALMALDMFTSRRGKARNVFSPGVPPAQSGEPAATFEGVIPGALGGAAAVRTPAPDGAMAPPADAPAQPTTIDGGEAPKE